MCRKVQSNIGDAPKHNRRVLYYIYDKTWTRFYYGFTINQANNEYTDLLFYNFSFVLTEDRTKQ